MATRFAERLKQHEVDASHGTTGTTSVDLDRTTLYDPVVSSDQVLFRSRKQSHSSDLPMGA